MNILYFNRPFNPIRGSIERVFFSVQEGLKKQHITKIENYYISRYRFWPFGMLINIIKAAIISRKNKGISHICGDVHYLALLMPKNRTVLTIHDLVILNNPLCGKLYQKFVYFLWYYFPLKKLKYITCISEATRADLISRFPFVKDKVRVISNPVDEGFIFTKSPEHDIPVILHIGTRENKNLERVIMALEGLKCRLRIVGTLSEEQKELLEHSNITYSNVSNLSDEEIIEEYKNSDIVSFPSLFEGFGMPIVEAQKSGRPVLTSNREPMLSVAGRGAIFVNPEDITSIKRGFEKIIHNKEMRENLITKGLQNSSRFSTSTISKEYINLYKFIIN